MIYEKCGEIQPVKVKARLIRAEIKGKTMTITAACPAKKFDWCGFAVSYNHKIAEDKETYYIKPSRIKKGKKFVTMTLVIDLDSFPFRMTHWSVFAVYREGSIKYGARIRKENTRMDTRQFLLRKNYYATADGNIIFNYQSRGNTLGIRYREKSPYDNMRTRYKELLAVFYFNLRRKSLERRKIWLIYEKKCEKAQDNGYHFFKYCMDNDVENALGREIYYVIKKSAADRKKLRPYSRNVISFMSLRFMIYMLASKLLLSSDSRSHAYIWQSQDSMVIRRIRKKPHVFLGHGVLAIKKLNDSFLAKNMQSALVTVTSQAEQDIFINELGYKKHQAVITGYARFDALEDRSGNSNEILLMPTHRSWLFGVERKVFTESEYYRRYMNLINSEELPAMLGASDAILNFYLHPSIGEHLSAFSSKSDRVRIIPYGKYALDDLMMRSKLLITDYSSIAWDVYYMGKPMLFYQYDTQEYLDTWGSYIDLDKDMPGECVRTQEELIKRIGEYMDNGFVMKPEFAAKREEHYAFSDRDNSKRICELLKKRNL